MKKIMLQVEPEQVQIHLASLHPQVEVVDQHQHEGVDGEQDFHLEELLHGLHGLVGQELQVELQHGQVWDEHG